jgi:IclR family transcriptional regulator, acetate operon repressor
MALKTEAKSAAKPRVQSAARTIDILQAVAREGAFGLSAKDISDQLKIPRQVIYHLVHTLVSVDMLRKVDGSNYVLGLGMAALAQGFRRQMATADHIARYADLVARETGEAAYVSGWVDGEIVVLASARGSAPIQAAEVPQGQAGNAHARASGKLLLAMSSAAETASYLRGHNFNRLTPNTIVDPDAFEAELGDIRKDWIGYDREEFSLGLSCMAVPIGQAPAQFVLGVSAPTPRFLSRRADYLAVLRRIGGDL